MRISRTVLPGTLAAILLAATAALPLTAQSVPTRTLDRPEAEYPDPATGEGFTSLTGVRELPDGRVIVSDLTERRLVLIDLARGTSLPIAREGGGPDEYRIPSRLHGLPGDTTLLYDPANGRFLVLIGAGRVAGTLLLEDAQGARLPGGAFAFDDEGGMYYRRDRYARPQEQRRMEDTPSDAVILRFDRRTKRMDTLAVLAVPRGRMQGARALGGGLLQQIDTRPLAAEDVVAVAPDGRVAVVRAADYRVEWISLDGRRTLGPPVAFSRIRVSDAEKRAFLDGQVRPGQIITSGPAEGAGSRALPRQPPAAFRQPATAIDDPEIVWPATKPPFLAGAARVAPDGTLWVLRTRAHDDPVPTYDLFDAAGRLTRRVALPPRTRLLGFGAEAVYLVRSDADDLQYLQRHRI